MKKNIHFAFLTRYRLLCLFFLTILCLFFFFPSICFQGAQRGLLLWFQTVLPSLFPFMLLSNLMITFQVSDSVSKLFYPIFRLILPIQKSGAYPLVIGMLSGYPVGAKTCNDLLLHNQISKKDAQFLLGICNNASPMFLTCYVVNQCLNIPKLQVLIMVLVFTSNYIGTMIVAYFYHFFYKIQDSAPALSNKGTLQCNQKIPFLKSLDSSIQNCGEVLVKVGGYIIIFSIFAQFVYTFLPYTITTLITGFLEITTGIFYLSNSTFSIQLKIALATAMVTFGGLCSFAQTKSVITCSGLSPMRYFITKVISGIVAFCITLFLLNII